MYFRGKETSEVVRSSLVTPVFPDWSILLLLQDRISYAFTFEFVSCCSPIPHWCLYQAVEHHLDRLNLLCLVSSCMLTGCICTKIFYCRYGYRNRELQKWSWLYHSRPSAIPCAQTILVFKTWNSISFVTMGRYKHQLNWKVVCMVLSPSPAHGRPCITLW